MIGSVRLELIKALRWALYRVLVLYPSPGAIRLVVAIDRPLRRAIRPTC